MADTREMDRTMKTIFRTKAVAVVLGLAVLIGVPGCTDLVVEPESTVVAANIFNEPESYRAFLAKIYAGLAVTGQQGPSGNSDIQGIDEGFGQYIRGLWQLQELPTDEAVIGWGDVGLPELVTMQWSSNNQFVRAMYARIFYQIALANEFLRETTVAKMEARGASAGLIEQVQGYRAEARWLRALSYWHAIDLFGNVSLVDEDFVIGATPPQQATRSDVYNFIVSELTEIRDELPGVGQAEYGRADQGAVAMLLAKLYLNAAAYGVGDASAQAMTEAASVISGPYQLDDNYQEIFLADNHTSPEIVFAVPFDGENTQTWGGTTFLVAASIVGNMNAADYGTGQKWNGLRVPPQFVNKYEGGAGGPDGRSHIFYTNGQSLQISELGAGDQGYGYPKYQNKTSTGGSGSHSTHMDTDYPMFRLADAYLIYAEACLRSGGGGCASTALDYVNAIRERAYGDDSGNITADQLTLDFIIDERARELGWEGHRRTDLIRFGLFTGGNYLWAWKGGVQNGQAVADYLALYPIPATDLLTNPNLTQNPGY